MKVFAFIILGLFCLYIAFSLFDIIFKLIKKSGKKNSAVSSSSDSELDDIDKNSNMEV